MEEVIVYEKSTCSKCRETQKLLTEAGVAFRSVRYHETPLTPEKILDLAQKIGIRPHELFRTKEAEYKSLGLKDKELTDEEVATTLSKHPDLLERPIVEKGEQAILGRPPENVHAIL